MSAKPTPNRDYFLARIARALGCAGYSVEECYAIMAWAQIAHPAMADGRIPCRACEASGHVEAMEAGIVASAEEHARGMTEQTRFLVQGICLACRGRGFTT